MNILFPAIAFPSNILAMKKSGPIVLSELLTAGTIQLDLQSNSRDAVLQELVKGIPAIASVPEAQDTLLKALQEREQLYSTGIGDGVALPHARNALVGLVNEPVIVLGRHKQGIAYGAIDGVPARLFFLLVAPTVTQHLAVLARISRLLRDQKVRQGLMTVENANRALEIIREAEARL